LGNIADFGEFEYTTRVPAYKNQHFLPAAYLRHFSVDGERGTRTSDIWRTGMNGQTRGPVDSFCSADYFYSKEDAERVEREFGQMEAFYGGLGGKFWRSENPRNERDYLGLAIMMFDLHLRSAAYARQPRDNYKDYLVRTSGFRNQLLFGQRDKSSTDGEVVDHFRENWSIRILEAGPGRSFLPSDNPSLLFHACSSDTVQLVLMPLTPRYYAVAFDHRAFGFVSIAATRDDETKLNQLQVKHCIDCIFSAEQLSDEQIQGVQKLLGTRQPRPVCELDDAWIANTHRIPAGEDFNFIREVR
jgi:hypothetical protein